MTPIAAAWTIVVVMCVWSLYLFFAWHGADSLPMQWGLSGKPTWFATRGVALAFFPCLAIFLLLLITFGKRHGSAGNEPVFVSLLLLVIQAAWTFFVRRYV